MSGMWVEEGNFIFLILSIFIIKCVMVGGKNTNSYGNLQCPLNVKLVYF